MSVVLSTLSVTELLERRSLIDTEIINRSGGSAVTDLKDGKKPRKTSKNKGQPTAWGAFSSKIQSEHKEQIAAFKAANPDVKSAHLKYPSNYRKEHEDEWNAFEAKWLEEHPKSDAPSETESTEEPVAEEVTTKADKPKRVISDEQKAKMKDGREKAAAAKKAAKAAEETTAKGVSPLVSVPATDSTPVAAKKPVKKGKKAAEPVVAAPTAVVEAHDLAELLPFKKGPSSFLRLGFKRSDGNHLWENGYLWQAKKDGSRGDYVGCLQDSGVIDDNVEEPVMEAC